MIECPDSSAAEPRESKEKVKLTCLQLDVFRDQYDLLEGALAVAKEERAEHKAKIEETATALYESERLAKMHQTHSEDARHRERIA